VSTHNITQNKQNTVHKATMQTVEDWICTVNEVSR